MQFYSHSETLEDSLGHPTIEVKFSYQTDKFLIMDPGERWVRDISSFA